MAKTLFDIREEKELMEKLKAADPTGKWIHDFVKSDNPKFAGKSKKERIRMALGAAYAAKKEEVDLDEGMQQTLRKVVPGYAKKQINDKMDAQKFGKTDVDKDANYYRYKKVMDKVKNEEVEQIDEVKHRVAVTVSDPNHSMVSKRKETIQKTIRIKGDDRETAIKGAIAHYKRKGYKVHDHHYIGTVNEEIDLDEAIKLGSKVMIHAPGKSYHGKTGHVGEIRNGAFKGAPKTYTVDHDGGSIQLDKKNIKMQAEEVDLDEGILKTMKRVSQGWGHDPIGVGSNPKDIVKRNKAHDTETAKKLSANLSSAKPHTPAGLQKKVLDRKLAKEDTQVDEAAWGKDKMANLKAAHDRHSEKAIAANKAGDHEAVKVHHSKMNMIKTQMNNLRKEDVELDEVSQKTAGDYKAKASEYIKKYKYSNNPPSVTQKLNKRIAGSKRADTRLNKEEAELVEAEFEVGHSHHKTTRMTYSRLEAKNAKDVIAKSQKPGHDLVHVYNMDKETFHHPKTGRKMQDQYNEAYKEPPMSAQEKLYQKHQSLRKKRGLPDPEHYKKLGQQKAQEILDLKNEK